MHDLIIFHSSQFTSIVVLMTSIKLRHGTVTNLVHRNQVHLQFSLEAAFSPQEAGLINTLPFNRTVRRCRFLSSVLIVCKLPVFCSSSSFSSISKASHGIDIFHRCCSASSSRGTKMLLCS